MDERNDDDDDEQQQRWRDVYGDMTPEKIVDTKIGEDGKRYYKVQWAASSFEPAKNFMEAELLIKKYWDPVEKKLKLPKRKKTTEKVDNGECSTSTQPAEHSTTSHYVVQDDSSSHVAADEEEEEQSTEQTTENIEQHTKDTPESAETHIDERPGTDNTNEPIGVMGKGGLHENQTDDCPTKMVVKRKHYKNDSTVNCETQNKSCDDDGPASKKVKENKDEG